MFYNVNIMSLSALKRKTYAKYGNHSNTTGFSLNGNTRYPGYIGKQSNFSTSGPKQNNTCCSYFTNSPDSFQSVKNYNAIHKHGRLTKWYKRDYTRDEWKQALDESGLTLDEYPYPLPGTVQIIKNNWVQKNEHGESSSHIYTHNKKHKALNKELECIELDNKQNIFDDYKECTTGTILTDNKIIRHKCYPITKDIKIGNDSVTALNRAKHRRGLLNPHGYQKPFPYQVSASGFRSCQINHPQAIDALKNGYYKELNGNALFKDCSKTLM